jgi:hypothetical protein
MQTIAGWNANVVRGARGRTAIGPRTGSRSHYGSLPLVWLTRSIQTRYQKSYKV